MSSRRRSCGSKHWTWCSTSCEFAEWISVESWLFQAALRYVPASQSSALLEVFSHTRAQLLAISSLIYETRSGKCLDPFNVYNSHEILRLQQHGTVYWGKGSRNQLRNLNPDKFLHEQLATSFSSTLSPIWMDSSTGEQCKILEDAAGGPRVRAKSHPTRSFGSSTIILFSSFSQKLAEITGSRAYERFSGPQIAKLARERPDAYNNTEVKQLSIFFLSLCRRVKTFLSFS